jgi:hypothetical protein
MTALEPETQRLIYEAIGSLLVALIAAWLLFGLFFDDWSDYCKCCRRRSYFAFLLSDEADVSDQSRGFIYNAIWLGVGGGTFYFIHKYFG